VKFFIVGSHTPPSIQRLAGDDVIVTGFVRDVQPLFDACRLSVAPLRYGAGVKGKITHSMAWGLPVVATPVAAEGLRLVDRDQIMIASDAPAFAERMVTLYRDELVWRRMSEQGRRHIQKHLGFDAIRRSVAAMLERHLDQKTVAAARIS
jgi:glycosyltransferase involved in cell wall biosynthesis